jgi:hypothetical protein
VQTYGKTFPTNNNICQPRISNLDCRLLPPQCDISHIGLHLPKGECKFVLLINIGDGGLGRELDEVVGFEGDDVGEGVAL